MNDADIIRTLKTAAESQHNIALKMLLTITAERLEKIANAPSAAFVVLNAEGKVVSVNMASSESWTGHTCDLIERP